MWGANSIQFVWFANTSEQTRADQLYETLVGSEPDSYQRNKFPTPANPLLGSANGAVGLAYYQLQVQVGRFDLIVTVAEDNAEPSEEVPRLDTAGILATVVGRIQGADLAVENVTRLSTVVQLVRPVANMADGINDVFALTGFNPGFMPDSEILLQLNSRKTIRNRQFNRLVRYSVMSMQNIMVNVAFPSGSQNTFPLADLKHATNVMLDFNTVPDGLVIDAAAQRTIFGDIADEISRVGKTCEIRALA